MDLMPVSSGSLSAARTARRAAMTHDWQLIIHGGSGGMTRAASGPAIAAAAEAGLAAALAAGADLLAAGGSAADAVVAAAQVLEEDPVFNAGRGAALAASGRAELDAAIMRGDGRHAGAVSGLTTTRSPVAAAREVMDHSPHVLLAGPDADAFATAQGLEQVANDWFVTDARRAQLAERLIGGGFDTDMKYGTIGAVARDRHGRLAAATSTGGLTAKRFGRIGDSPLIGAGTYAEGGVVALSGTGLGEAFIRAVAGHQVAARMRWGGQDVDAAVAATLADIGALGGTGGLIALAADGRMTVQFTTPAMYRGRADASGRHVAIDAAD